MSQEHLFWNLWTAALYNCCQLRGLEWEQTCEGEQSPCSSRTQTSPEPGDIPAGGCLRGKKPVSSFRCDLRVTPSGDQSPGQSCRATRWGFLLALFPQGWVAESSWFVLLLFDLAPPESLENKTLKLWMQINTPGSRRKQISTWSKNFSLKGLKIDFSCLGNSSLVTRGAADYCIHNLNVG